MEYKTHIQKNNKCYITGAKLKPKGIMLHSTATPGVIAQTFADRWDVYQPNGNSVCVHGFLDNKEFIQTLPFDMRAWHCGGNGNSECIGFEICEPKDYADREYFEQVKQNALWICSMLIKQYNIPIENITSHCEAYAKKGSSYASNHADLDHWWKKYFNYTIEDFRNELEYGNYRELEYLGVNKWHSMGYLGEGITVANREEYEDGESPHSKHSRNTYFCINEVAPKSNIITGIDLDQIKNSGADVFTMSMFKKAKDDIAKLENGVGNTICCCAIGNEGDDHYCSVAKVGVMWGIGACVLPDNWKPIPTDYTSLSEYVDFMSFSNFYNKDRKLIRGTSFSSPTFAGMIALVQEFFLKNAGRKLYRNELYEFIKDNSVDIGDKGKDVVNGYGIFILPNPDSINIGNYIGDDDVLRYNSYEECPDWSKPTIKKLMEKGALQGDEHGNLDLSLDMIRMLVINDREHLYDYE